ncbi:MAG TPA: hypothetical protein VG962_04890 [Steroidobacteraceae bacterium]|nr:hypothetical protein [Steroidobacteraceae bacterium]
MRILVLGGRAPVALEHSRRFANAGHEVWIGDSVSCHLSASSQLVRGVITLPPPRWALDQFARTLSHAIHTHRFELVLPTCEEVFFLSRIRRRLPASCNVFVAPFEQLLTLHSKLQFIELAKTVGINVPDTAGVTSLVEARDWARGRPVVLKPEFSRFGVHVRIYPSGIPDDSSPLAEQGNWVVQEYRKGREICSYGISVNGRLLANVCYEPTYRIKRSSSYYFEPANIPEIENFVRRFVEHLNYTGQISFDWIISENSSPTIIECNPRAISGLHLFHSDCQIPAAILGEATAKFDVNLARPKMIAAVMLAIGFPSSVRHGSLRRWLYDWSRASDVLSIRKDRAPLLGAMRDIGSFVKTSLRQGCSVREASTRDIEWDGEALPEC